MGCTRSTENQYYIKGSLAREEIVLSNLEKNLSFSYRACREMVNTFRLNSFSGKLNKFQLTRAFNDLS